MKDMGKIQGSAEQAKEIIVGTDTVYVHTNIEKITKDKDGNDTDNLYSYNEVQYDKDEYIELMAKKNKELETQVTDTEIALVEIYESLGV